MVINEEKLQFSDNKESVCDESLGFFFGSIFAFLFHEDKRLTWTVDD